MLNDIPLVPNLGAPDIAATRAFYQDKLGFKVVEDHSDDAHVLFEAGGGVSLFVYKKEDVAPANNTALSFFVGNIEERVRELKNAGVTFEEYDVPGMTFDDGIATGEMGKAAWFKDPSGHILALYDM